MQGKLLAHYPTVVCKLCQWVRYIALSAYLQIIQGPLTCRTIGLLYDSPVQHAAVTALSGTDIVSAHQETQRLHVAPLSTTLPPTAIT